MSIINKDAVTEELIKDTARKIFFGEGRFNATTQEIADAASVNRTLINYYFRSRNALFELVFQDAQNKQREKVDSILFSELPFRSKVEAFIDNSFKIAKEYPYMEIYLVTQINQGCSFYDEKDMDRILNRFYKTFEIEVEKGTVERMEPKQFILNMISLISYPLSMRPLFQKTLKISDNEYIKLLENRKQIILKTIFK